mmetsp:Transcript_5550/g.12600  ORF Transcript_5550/g.12600 Transcript_5550/m.12600 type:complete len:163 (-) Transcript_5550:411-899(-)|eukprot:CAMPEP_0170597384 /NCGR_PEP_ID=MMETSP0224-20130122/15681_1 /TAXON_ID=285029 /ORGANISM="Togula jolla, Strain CCCM 725" /LENGTH=162 /DNA_ID=CAMNT_0010921857 /DNA_START=53 /DNA_END=541 /DNA_ORIENTATION=-
MASSCCTTATIVELEGKTNAGEGINNFEQGLNVNAKIFVPMGKDFENISDMNEHETMVEFEGFMEHVEDSKGKINAEKEEDIEDSVKGLNIDAEIHKAMGEGFENSTDMEEQDDMTESKGFMEEYLEEDEDFPHFALLSENLKNCDFMGSLMYMEVHHDIME